MIKHVRISIHKFRFPIVKLEIGKVQKKLIKFENQLYLGISTIKCNFLLYEFYLSLILYNIILYILVHIINS